MFFLLVGGVWVIIPDIRYGVVLFHYTNTKNNVFMALLRTFTTLASTMWLVLASEVEAQICILGIKDLQYSPSIFSKKCKKLPERVEPFFLNGY